MEQPAEGQSAPSETSDSVETDNPEYDINAPEAGDMAEMFGGGTPEREEDLLPIGTGELPDLEKFKDRIPDKTHVLMEELFRAKLSRVQRINPKSIR